MNPLEAARACLAKLPPAISGAGGHRATFRAACCIARFGLSDLSALTLLHEWNKTHCQPPWTEKELLHKLNDARRAVGAQTPPIKSRPAVRVIWKIEREVPLRVVPPVATPVSGTDKTGHVSTVASHDSPKPASNGERSGAEGLAPDQAAWLPVAKRVVSGQFDGATRSTCESLIIGLRGTPHPMCRPALIRLERPSNRSLNLTGQQHRVARAAKSRSAIAT
jgi:hypothetical protein